MKIYLTRHSQTIWNQEGRLQGHQDSPLTADGKENALALKKYIQDINFDYIYSSPILRAYTTACLLFDKQEQDIIQDERLSEMNFGIFEGQKTSDIAKDKNNSELYRNLWDYPEKFTRIPDGESYDEVIKRVKSFLDNLKQLDNDSTIMIVTHGMYFIVMLATMLKLDKKDFVKISHQVVQGCSLTLVTYDNINYQLEFYNQHDFLPHTKTPSFIK